MPENDHSQEPESTSAEQSPPTASVEGIATTTVQARPPDATDAKKDIITVAIQSLPPEAAKAKAELVATALKSLPSEDRTGVESLLAPASPPLLQENRFLLYALIGGRLLFFAASFAAIAAVVLLVVNVGAESPIRVTTDADAFAVLRKYLSVSLNHVILLITAGLSAAIGYMIFRTTGDANKEVIPWNDRKLLSKLLIEGNSIGIDEYVKLSSLSGITGFFTKIQVSGLPLATIALTIIFALLSIGGNEAFSELAKLALGAFLGSYVQQRVGERKTELETARTTAGSGGDRGACEPLDGQRQHSVQN